MRVSLKVGATVYPLAGESGVSERTHTSAADFTLTPQAEKQLAAFVRGEYAKPIDRGNLLNVVSFTTTRLFGSPAAAQLWCLDYDDAFPRAGTLVFESVFADASIKRFMIDAVIDPPRRRCVGATAILEYTVSGGQIQRESLNVAGTSGDNGVVWADGNPIDGYDNYNSEPTAEIQLYWFSLTEKWVLISTGYRAEKSSLATSPVGLTGWTLITGTGQPTITSVL